MCGLMTAFGNSVLRNKEQLIELGGLLKHRGPDFSDYSIRNDSFFGSVAKKDSMIEYR